MEGVSTGPSSIRTTFSGSAWIQAVSQAVLLRADPYSVYTSHVVKWRCNCNQLFAALAVSLGSLVVGFSSSYSSPATVSMRRPESSLKISDSDVSWIGSSMPLAAILGGIVGGPLIELIGRRNTILFTGGPFLLAFLLIFFAKNVGMVLAGRALTGLSVGMASLAFPVYLSETIEPKVRGTLGLLPTTLGNLGILLGQLGGTWLDWKWLALMGACLPVPFLVCTAFIPESPVWWVSRGRELAAEDALQWLRGPQADVTAELTPLLKAHQTSQTSGLLSIVKKLGSRRNLKPLFISLGLMFFQQFSGINAVIFYTVLIFKEAGSSLDSNVSSIIVGLLNLVAILAACFLIDRLGRKILLYISDFAMCLCLASLATFFYLKHTKTDLEGWTWVPLPCLFIFILAFAIGAGPVPWLLMGEILPEASVRGPAASIVTAFNWTTTFVVTKTFPDIKEAWGAHVPFYGFSFVCLLGVLFTFLYVPETRGKTLRDIEAELTGRHFSLHSTTSSTPGGVRSMAILRPFPSTF